MKSRLESVIVNKQAVSQTSDKFCSMANQSNQTSTETPYMKDLLSIWLVAFLVVSFLIFASNLATISTFLINRHLRRHSVFCLLNLAIADMVHGLCSIFWYLVYLDWLGMDLFSFSLNDDGMNVAAGLVNTSTLVLSLASLLLVSLDRVVATFYPFTHRAATSKIYIKVFAVTWGLALVVAFLPVFITEWTIYGHDVWFRTLDFLCILCLIVIILSYTAIFIKIRLKNNQHRQHEQEMSIRRRQKREKHLAMTLFIVTILSLMTWLPFIINHEIELVASLTPGPAQHNIELLVEIVQLTNSLINPIVYVFRMKEFREALVHLLLRCSRVQPRRICPSLSNEENDAATNATATTSERTQELGIVCSKT